jgi:Peptidase A4 family
VRRRRRKRWPKPPRCSESISQIGLDRCSSRPAKKPLRVPAHRFCAIEGEWTVPAAKPTINCTNPHEPTDGSSLWIAIDGWSATFKAHVKGKDGKWHTYPSTDILQAGSESDVPCYHGGPLKSYKTAAYFWIEWSGKTNIAVTRHSQNLPLHAGDKIYVRIAATTSGPRAWQEATLWFVNETTAFHLPPRTFHSGCVDCGTPFHRPATLFGNTAEWITEATFYSSDNPKWPNTLDDFGTVEMTHVDATDQDGVTYDLANPLGAIANIDWMTWNGVPLPQNGTLMACAAIEGAREARFTRAPYVIATPGQQGDLEPKPKRC